MKPVDIPIRFEHGAPTLTSGNVLPLLHEIKHSLKKLVQEGDQTIIDLRAIPLGPGDEAALRVFLGQGEVTASVNAMGKSEIMETGFAGVWTIVHYNQAGEVIGRFIEITRIPALLESQAEEMTTALVQLRKQLLMPHLNLVAKQRKSHV